MSGISQTQLHNQRTVGLSQPTMAATKKDVHITLKDVKYNILYDQSTYPGWIDITEQLFDACDVAKVIAGTKTILTEPNIPDPPDALVQPEALAGRGTRALTEDATTAAEDYKAQLEAYYINVSN